MALMQYITEKTKFGMSIAQWVTVVISLLGIGGVIAGMGAGIQEARNAGIENKQKISVNEQRIKQLETERAKDNRELLNMIYEIRESQIRVEGKLDMKMDKYN